MKVFLGVMWLTLLLFGVAGSYGIYWTMAQWVDEYTAVIGMPK